MLRENLHTNYNNRIIPNSLQVKKKNHEFLSADKWMNKLEHMHAMKYYVVVKNYLLHVITWMILENASLIHRCQATEDSISHNPIIWNVFKS